MSKFIIVAGFFLIGLFLLFLALGARGETAAIPDYAKNFQGQWEGHPFPDATITFTVIGERAILQKIAIATDVQDNIGAIASLHQYGKTVAFTFFNFTGDYLAFKLTGAASRLTGTVTIEDAHGNPVASAPIVFAPVYKRPPARVKPL